MSTTGSKIDLHVVRQHVTEALVAMEPLFVREAKLTFVMRVPDRPGAHLVITSDANLGEVVKIIEHQMGKPEHAP